MNTFRSTSWEEERPAESTGPRVAHAHLTYAYEGVIEGSSGADLVLYYAANDAPGSYHGYEQVTGIVGGREGTFVCAHTGSFDDTTVRGTFSVVAGSGTGGLEGLRGSGGFTWTHGGGESTPYTFEHGFA